MISDEQLAERSGQGDRDAFRTLIQRHEGGVFRFVFSYVASHHVAEDLSQEVFVSAYRALARFDPSRARFTTWLYTIAKNRCRNHLRRHPPSPQEPREHELAAYEPEHGGPEREEFMRHLDRALAALPESLRVAFQLAEVEQLAYAEIAEREAISIGTVKSRVHRAKRALRSQLPMYEREP